MKSFIYQSANGLLNVNTLSPSGKYYYLVQEPKELNKSAFGCKIAFYTLDGELLYHHSKMYAHELHSKEEINNLREKMELSQLNPPMKEGDSIEVVKWSKQGNLAYFLEYYSWNFDKVYESVFLNLKERFCFRIDEMKNNFEIADALNLHDRKFNEDEIINKLESLGLQHQELIKEKLQGINLLGNLLNRDKWYPDNK
jgi:hypothetical protein